MTHKSFPVNKTGTHYYHFDEGDMMEMSKDFKGGVVCLITTSEGRGGVVSQVYGGFHLFTSTVEEYDWPMGDRIALGNAGIDMTEGKHLDHYLITDVTDSEELAELANCYLFEACALTLFNQWTNGDFNMTHHDIFKVAGNTIKYAKREDSTQEWSLPRPSK
jgi:hypothetical protein